MIQSNKEQMIDLTGLSKTASTKNLAKEKAILTVEQEMLITENPSRLTKEGVLTKVNSWRRASNIYTQKFYDRMFLECKNLAESGKTTDGNIILSRNEDGTPKWTENPDRINITVPSDLKKRKK